MPVVIPKYILIIAIRAIGDVVLITPLLSEMKRKYPDASLSILVDGISAQVLERNPFLDHVFVIDRARSKQFSWFTRWKLWAQLVTDLRKHQFDIVIDLFSGPRSAILAYMTKAKERYGEDFQKSLRGFLYNHPINISRDGKHLIEQKIELIQPLTGKDDCQELPLEVYLTKDERFRAQQLLGKIGNEQKKRIGLIPSAGSKWRVWPYQRFTQLADVLVDVYGAEIILLGSDADISSCRHIAENMRSRALDLSGRTTLRESMAVFGEMDLLIANVTGPMHLAVALSQPKVIGLYGVADTIQYAPWGTHGVMLTKGTTDDAYWNKVDYRRDYEMLCQITVDDVLSAVKSVMPQWQVCQ